MFGALAQMGGKLVRCAGIVRVTCALAFEHELEPVNGIALASANEMPITQFKDDRELIDAVDFDLESRKDLDHRG